MTKIYFTVDQIDTPKCEKECQETVITWMRTDDSIILSTSDPLTVTKMKNRMRKAPDLYKCFSYENNRDVKTGKYFSYFFEFPKKLLHFGTSISQNRKPFTEEQRQAAADRFRKMWEEKRARGEVDESEEMDLEELMEIEMEGDNED